MTASHGTPRELSQEERRRAAETAKLFFGPSNQEQCRLAIVWALERTPLSESGRRIPNVDHLTVQELQALNSHVMMLLQHKVCGDPMQGVSSTPMRGYLGSTPDGGIDDH